MPACRGGGSFMGTVNDSILCPALIVGACFHCTLQIEGGDSRFRRLGPCKCARDLSQASCLHTLLAPSVHMLASSCCRSWTQESPLLSATPQQAQYSCAHNHTSFSASSTVHRRQATAPCLQSSVVSYTQAHTETCTHKHTCTDVHVHTQYRQMRLVA